MNAQLATVVADPSRVREIDPEVVPELLGELEAVRAALWARLHVPAAPVPAQVDPDRGDPLLTAAEAAERLAVSKRWIYRQASGLPFTRRLSDGTLRFSSKGLERWKKAR